MNEIIGLAQSVEKLGVTGILAGLVIILSLVIKKLWSAREDCLKQLIKAHGDTD